MKRRRYKTVRSFAQIARRTQRGESIHSDRSCALSMTETLVQGISGALNAPADATCLDRVEKVQLEMKQAQEVVEEAGKARHEALLALFTRERT